MKEITVGSKLENGSIVLAIKQVPNNIVLCDIKGDGRRYMTCRVDNRGETYWSHYFFDLKKAVADFEAR